MLRPPALLVALVLAGSGCTRMTLPDDLSTGPPWPLRSGLEGPRPTLLVRTGPPRGEALLDGPGAHRRMRGVLQDSGLFAAVAHQELRDGYRVRADYTLDLDLRAESEVAWYTLLGLLPGVPMVAHKTLSVSCRVRDRARREMGRYQSTARTTVAFGLVFLPLSLQLGLDPGRWLAERIGGEARLAELLTRQVLAEAHAAISFRSPPRPADRRARAIRASVSKSAGGAR